MWLWHLFQQGAFGNRFKDSKSGRAEQTWHSSNESNRVRNDPNAAVCTAYLSVDLRKQIGLSCCEATLLSMRLLAYLSARNLNPHYFKQKPSHHLKYHCKCKVISLTANSNSAKWHCFSSWMLVDLFVKDWLRVPRCSSMHETFQAPKLQKDIDTKRIV